jgi:hypothetical protein
MFLKNEYSDPDDYLVDERHLWGVKWTMQKMLSLRDAGTIVKFIAG